MRTLDLRGTSEGPGPAMYPRTLIAALAIVMVVRIAQQVLAIRRGDAHTAEGAESQEDGAEDDPATLPLTRVWTAAAAALAFIVATVYLGWVIATVVFVPVFLFISGKRNPLITIPLGVGLGVGSAYLFVKVVYIALPTGVGVFDEMTVRLFESLGIY